MGDVLIDAACIALTFALAKYVEARILRKERPNTKAIMKDGVLVCLSAAGALALASQLGVGAAGASPTQAFVGKPEF
tara:strand:+ start:304 stop:534 length:231 start_codon:yes stop_codon:yes gene_type:complete